MKQRRFVIFLAVACACAGVFTAASAATPEVESEGVAGLNVPDSSQPDPTPSPAAGASERLLDRAYMNLDRLPAELQEDVSALRESSESIRRVWESEYRPDPNAGVEEISAARRRFAQERADEIAANRDLRQRVVTGLRSELRDRLDDEEWNVEARAAFQEYDEIKQRLDAEWRQARAALGANPTREEVAQARQRFLKANADLVAQQQQRRAQFRANVETSRLSSERGQLPMALQDLRSEMLQARKELQERRREAREELLDLAPQDRELRRQEIVEELRDALNEVKDRRRQLIEEMRDENGGDRRPED